MMAHFYFVYAAMKSGKSLDLLKTAHNYERQRKKVMLFTSARDTRNGKLAPDALKGTIATRLGLKREAWLLERVDALELAAQEQPNCVLVDEVQFLEEKHVLMLSEIVDRLGIPVIGYGLKNDFLNRLFPGSQAMLALADKYTELKTVCVYCDSKATMNMRLHDGKPIFHGRQIVVGDEDYEPVCRKCYKKHKTEAEQRAAD